MIIIINIINNNNNSSNSNINIMWAVVSFWCDSPSLDDVKIQLCKDKATALKTLRSLVDSISDYELELINIKLDDIRAGRTNQVCYGDNIWEIRELNVI